MARRTVVARCTLARIAREARQARSAARDCTVTTDYADGRRTPCPWRDSLRALSPVLTRAPRRLYLRRNGVWVRMDVSATATPAPAASAPAATVTPLATLRLGLLCLTLLCPAMGARWVRRARWGCCIALIPVPQHAPQSHSYRLPSQTAVHSPANFRKGQPRLDVLIQPTLSRPRALTMPTMALPRKNRELPQYFRIATDMACRTPANRRAVNPYLRSAAARSPSRSHESNSATSLPSDSEATTC